ncbi:MAG: signal peptide peptidase SppA [Verrucomicrobiae bacterium]|nr:signal peptide peptidase SppA [Verrucomicrobiae bacterium]
MSADPTSPVPPPPPPPRNYQYQLPPPPKPRRRVGLWLVLLLSLLLNLGLLVGFSYKSLARHGRSVPAPEHVFTERFIMGYENAENKIAVIRLNGVISSFGDSATGMDGMAGDIVEQLRLAAADANVKAIVLWVDSPGGEVLASDRIYRAVRDADKVKPVICYMGTVAASGGFYSAMGARWIIADELTITGSIGVIMQTLNYEGLFGKVGLKSLTFKSGKLKDMLDGSREPTPEEKELVQGLIMETYDKFVGIVTSERKILDDSDFRENIADGRIFSGKKALENKLIDQLGTFDEAIAKAEKEAKIKDAEVFQYEVPFRFEDMFRLFGRAPANKVTLELPNSPSIHLEPGRLYFMSLHIF